MAAINFYPPFQLSFVLPQDFFSTSSSRSSEDSQLPPFSILEGELSKEDDVCEMLLNLKNELPSNIRFKVDEGLVIRPVERKENGMEVERSNTSMNRKRSLSENDSEPRENRSRSVSLPMGSVAPAIQPPQAMNRTSRSISSNNGNQSKKAKTSVETPKPLNGPEIALTHQARWMERFLELKEYREKHGTCNVTFAKEHESYKTLAYWVSNQRISYRKRNMPQERVDLLKSLGFDFNQTGRENGNNENSSESGSDAEKKSKSSFSPKKPIVHPSKPSSAVPSSSSSSIRPGDSFPRLPSPFADTKLGYLPESFGSP